MQPVAIPVCICVYAYLLQVLTLYQPYQQFFQVQIGVNIFAAVAAAANPHQFINEIGHFSIIIKMILVKLQFPFMLLAGIAVIIIIQVLNGVVNISRIHGKRNALGRIFRFCFRKINYHGFIARYNHCLTGQVIKSRLIKQVHYFFTPHHTGYYKITESKWHAVSLLVRFKNIQFAILQVKDAPVFYQRLQVFGMCEINALQCLFSRQAIRFR